jgi:hypothetical protein
MEHFTLKIKKEPGRPLQIEVDGHMNKDDLTLAFQKFMEQDPYMKVVIGTALLKLMRNENGGYTVLKQQSN